MQHAVITGGASGIGAATARRLATAGYKVGLLDLRPEAVKDRCDDITAAGGDAYPLVIDVTDTEAVRQAFADAGKHGDPTVLINGAGIVTVNRFEDFSPETWMRTYEINVVGPFQCMVAALPGLRASAQREGSPSRVVNVASAAAKRPGPFTAPYNASKAALINLSRTAALEWAPEVLVNSICPGVIETPMWERMDKELADLGAGPETSFERRSAAVPLGRAGTANEVAEAIAFLASSAASYMIGEDMNFSGGMVTY